MAKPQAGPDYRLSNSTLSMLRGSHPCRRCFSDHVRLGIERPRGAFPSITGGVDREIKAYTDASRPALPAWLAADLEAAGAPGAILWGTHEDIRKLRAWQSSFKAIVDGTTVVTGFDDLLLHADGSCSPLDGKSKGSAPKFEDAVLYYQSQGDILSLALDQNGLRPTGSFYLWFFWPAGGGEPSGSDEPPLAPRFQSEALRIGADTDRARELIREGVAVLNGNRPPLDRNGCEWCRYRGHMPAAECAEQPGPALLPSGAVAP